MNHLSTNKKQYWPLLDGLRAISVLAVVAFHTDLPFARSGYAGVDVFFVISGFLITRLLLDENSRDGRINLRQFYVRRAMRLLPALLTVCLFVLSVAVITRQHTAAVAKGVVACLLYVSNVWIYSGHDTIFLQHTWTLSLEEQFYIFWPILLILLIAAGPRRGVYVMTICAGAIVVLIWAPFGAVVGGVQANYLRGTGLLAGCVLAWCSTVWRLHIHPAMTTGSLIALTAVLFGPWRVPSWLLTSGCSIAALLTVPIVLGLTHSDSELSMLRLRPVTWIGQRSYGLYLWHFPILSLAIHQAPPTIPLAARITAGLAASLLATAASYHFIEAPMRRKGMRFKPQVRPPRGESITSAAV